MAGERGGASRYGRPTASVALLAVLDGVGPHEIEVKKTSLHVMHGRAFLGIHPRSGGLLLNIVTTAPLTGDRVRKSEPVSRNRCHNEILVTTGHELDSHLTEWIRGAYALTMT